MKTDEQRRRAVEASMRWRKRNLEKARAYNRRHYWKNADKYRKLRNESAKANRVKNRSRDRVYRRDRRKNIQWRLKDNLSRRISHAIDKGWFGVTTGQLLGCSLSNFLIYLESKFETGMTWENYGKVWHVDHIMPCAIFDLTKPEHQRRCFHFSNLQPMFARENIQKGAKIVTDQFNLL